VAVGYHLVRHGGAGGAQGKTFTIRFPGFGEHDETEHARLIARRFGTEHVELEAAESTLDLLPLLARPV